LLKLLGNKLLITNLLFRLSEDGLNNFHKYCDYKGPTISLLKVKDGDCIGGFTMANFYGLRYDRPTVGYGCAFLFNLSCFRHFPSKIAKKEIRQGIGFCFSGGD
jgi:hypothetical protein